MRKARRTPVLSVAAAASMLFGCASDWSPDSPSDIAAAARGEALAQSACSACHGMGREGSSSFPKAPAFRDMRIDYNAISHERRMAQLHAGRVGMPPASLSLPDVRDIVAYVHQLQPSPPDRDAAARRD